jgi:Glucosamine 6-phosphate synthetase, contains amidotransferase and phosphosugar isomerase domains
MNVKATPGILQFNAVNNRVEVIRTVVPVERGKETMYQLEEFLTGNALALVPAEKLDSIRQHEHLHLWSKELFMMEVYTNMVRDVHRVVEHHGANDEIFGPRNQHQLVIFHGNGGMKVGLRIDNEAMLLAIDCQTAGVTPDGHILRQGTVTRFKSILEMVVGKARHFIDSLPKNVHDAMNRQWSESINDEVDAVDRFYSRSFNEGWQDFLNINAVCDRLNVSPTTLNRYRDGRVPGDAPVFPAPDRFKGRSPYWHKTSLVRWEESRHH